MRSGFVSIVGRPNVGKSTLLNAMVGHKVAITTAVPQTTRHAVRGVLHAEGCQIVFVDTPGLHKPKTLLGNRLNDVARSALSDVDVILFLVDGSVPIGRGDRFIAGLLTDVKTPVIAVLNKVDAFSRARQLPQLQHLAALGDFTQIVPVSATTGDGLDILERLVLEHIPEGPAYFPADQVSDQTPGQIVAELVREKAITRMREEVPHSIAVLVEEMGPGESDDVTAIEAVVYVERDSQKGIVIGKGGEVLRDIGAAAREELETILGTRVYLSLRVKLMKEWQSDAKKLARLGY